MTTRNSYIDDGFDVYSERPWSMSVVEDNDQPEDTGLLNADGTKLYRKSPRIRMDFDLTPRSK